MYIILISNRQNLNKWFLKYLYTIKKQENINLKTNINITKLNVCIKCVLLNMQVVKNQFSFSKNIYESKILFKYIFMFLVIIQYKQYNFLLYPFTPNSTFHNN